MKFFFKHKKIFILFILAVVAVCFWQYENNSIYVNEIEMESSSVNDELTFIEICDLHGRTFGKNNKTLIDRIDKIDPDFICVTGDVFTRNDEQGRAIAEDLLEILAQRYRVFFVRGEHDGDKSFLNHIENCGVQVLAYDKQEITVKNTTVDIYGVSTVNYSESYNLFNEFEKPDEGHYNILMAHVLNPKAFADFGADLTLSGDTHGGQVRLPVIGPLIYDGIWFPKYNYQGDMYDKGLYEVDGVKMFVSSGLGSYPYPVRFFNRPEIAVFRVKPN